MFEIRTQSNRKSVLTVALLGIILLSLVKNIPFVGKINFGGSKTVNNYIVGISQLLISSLQCIVRGCHSLSTIRGQLLSTSQFFRVFSLPLTLSPKHEKNEQFSHIKSKPLSLRSYLSLLLWL